MLTANPPLTSSALPNPTIKRPSDQILPSWPSSSSSSYLPERPMSSEMDAYQTATSQGPEPVRSQGRTAPPLPSSQPHLPTPTTTASHIDSYSFTRTAPNYTLSNSPQQPHPNLPPYNALPSPTPSSASGHLDSYSYTTSRPPNFSIPSSTQHHLSSYSTLPSPTTQSPPTGLGPRGLLPVSGSFGPPPPASGMAPPQPYRPYPYQSLPQLNGPVMSNIHQPGGQMAIIPGLVQPLPFRNTLISCTGNSRKHHRTGHSSAISVFSLSVEITILNGTSEFTSPSNRSPAHIAARLSLGRMHSRDIDLSRGAR
uniref:Uncharacterized protein n=1 Tax=Bionectria ochroleuca TaxID=29856 RepID=A0A8H7NJK8_BIOOC